MENRFHRDLRLLMAIGGGVAVLILGVGAFALRGALWEETRGAVRELVHIIALGAGILAIVGMWAWGVARKIRRQRGGDSQPTPPGG